MPNAIHPLQCRDGQERDEMQRIQTGKPQQRETSERQPGTPDRRPVFPGEDEDGQAPEQLYPRIAIGVERRQQPV